MGNNLVQNLTKISGALSRSDHQKEAAYEKLAIMGLFLFPFAITVYNLKSFFTVGEEHHDINVTRVVVQVRSPKGGFKTSFLYN